MMSAKEADVDRRGGRKKLDIGKWASGGRKEKGKKQNSSGTTISTFFTTISTFFTTTPEESKNAGIIHIVHCRLPPGQRALGDTY